MVLIGGMEILVGVGSGCWVGLGVPVSIWTTCLKEVVLAWTKVVVYEFGSDLETGLRVSGLGGSGMSIVVATTVVARLRGS